MYILNLGEIEAVAFDIDGTLYRNENFYLRVIPHYIRNLFFFRKYNSVRKILHDSQENLSGYQDFYSTQAKLLSEKMNITQEEASAKLDKIIYTGLKKYFVKMNPCKGAPELIRKIKDAGCKVALLSDFPPEQKGEIWGIKSYCDVILSTEQIGALKPSTKPFEVMAQKLGVPAEKILYIGNNHTYDVVGPKKLGMKAGWFISYPKGLFGCRSKTADITFWKYSQLEQFIFNTTSE